MSSPPQSSSKQSHESKVSLDLWDDPEIQRTINSMDPEQRYKYSKIGQYLYSKNGVFDSINTQEAAALLPRSTDPQSDLFDLATQITLMLRDGMSIDELTPIERKVLIKVYKSEVEQFGIKYTPEDDDDDGSNNIIVL